MFFVSDSDSVFFPESSANCCLSGLECKPQTIDSFHSAGVHSTRCKKSRKSGPKSSRGVHLPFAAMSCEVKLNTLQGGVITLDIPITATVRELKAILLAKHPCRDPIERKILKVELLRDSSIIDDAETLDAAGFFCVESLVTVTYTRNEVEAATKEDIDDIQTQRFFGVKIPCNLTEISRYAFQNCNQLVLVTIRGSVTHIGEGAFAGCTSLTSISLGESVTHIGERAFLGCTSLTSMTMGESATHIGTSAFAGCTSLTSITVGEFVSQIGDYAFVGCTSLTSISIGESVTRIGVRAFAECTSLMSIRMGESVTHIGDGAFAGCTSLTSISIGQCVTHIGGGAFAGCTSLTSISIGESVTHIGFGAFLGCTSLASITCPESLRHILEWLTAESGNRFLKIITICEHGSKRLRTE